MKTGIIFDMDGTMWDSSEEVAASWTEVLKKEISPDYEITGEQMRSVMGLTMQDIAERLFRDQPAEKRMALMNQCTAHENEYLKKHGGRLYQNLEETLARLQQLYPLYIVSNCQSGYIEAFLEHYNFSRYFSDFECYGNNGQRKDENIKNIARRNYLDRYYYVGDTRGDYDATIRAGGRFIFASYGFGEVPESTSVIHEIAELPAYLAANDEKEHTKKAIEYSVAEMYQFIRMTENMYDIVRLVDPVECRVIHLYNDHIEYGTECYDVWDASHRCRDCSSYRACMSGHRDEKNELQKGNLFHIQSNPVAIRLDNQTVLPCVIEFITKRPATQREQTLFSDRRLEEGMEFNATQDSLTGLFNRESFYMNVRRLLMAEPEESWLLCVSDIRQFKLVNTLFGREKSNEILIEIAEIFKSYARANVIFARIQADQFGLFMPKRYFREEVFISGLERVRNLLAESAYTLVMQMGVYEVTDRNIAVSIMYDRALTALLSIHNEDFQTIAWFNESLLQNILYRQKVISAFDMALRDEEFQIYLQPQVNSRGKASGAEALVRWVRPDGSIVPPMDFIPILEEAGLIVKLDTYVWQLAAKQLDAWKGTEFEDFYISVNISPLDFYYIDVYEYFTELVNRFSLDRKKLKLEITESVLMSDAEKQIGRVQHLRESGFYLEIDDFGSGYSSLSMLKDIEADVLKIDMNFLRETEHTVRSREILRSIIDMSNKIGMDVITEGVETEAQLAMLNEMGCHMYQGFYFAKPMPVKEFEAYVRGMRSKANP